MIPEAREIFAPKLKRYLHGAGKPEIMSAREAEEMPIGDNLDRGDIHCGGRDAPSPGSEIPKNRTPWRKRCTSYDLCRERTKFSIEAHRLCSYLSGLLRFGQQAHHHPYKSRDTMLTRKPL